MGSYYRRRLPHWHPRGAGGFACHESGGGRVFVRLDRLADRAASGPKWRADERIARLVVDTMRIGERERNLYALHAMVVMPNHVHALLRPFAPVSRSMRWLKGSTARRANQLLGRTGQRFWQDESSDHWFLDGREFEKIIHYIERNPVAAGLADCAGEWP